MLGKNITAGTARDLAREKCEKPNGPQGTLADTSRDGNPYCFVRNNPINGVDPYGLAYHCESATVYIFVNSAQEPFNAGEMLNQLRAVVPEALGVFWKLSPVPLSAGTRLGFQGGISSGQPCNCLYFLEANVLPSTPRVGSATIPLLEAWGIGHGWIANAFIDNFKWDYDDNHSSLPGSWPDRNSSDGWQQMSGFIMAHEVVHAVGGHHSEKGMNLMNPQAKPKGSDLNYLLLRNLPSDILLCDLT